MLHKRREAIDRQIFGGAEFERATLSRKTSSEMNNARTETDTGRRGENPKVRGTTLVKELGKIYP